MSLPSLELTSKVYRAGAGAGKTYTLVNEVLHLARDFFSYHGRYPKIVVTTFTRKATQELRERLMQKVLENQEWELLKFVSSRSQLHISTIHGVLSAYLTRHGHMQGIDPSFKVMSAVDSARLARKILKLLLLREPTYAGLLEVFSVHELGELLQQYSAAHQQWPTLRPADQDVLSSIEREVRMQLAEQLHTVSETLTFTCPDWAASWKTFADELLGFVQLCVEKEQTQEEIQRAWAQIKAPQNRARKGEYPLSEEAKEEWESAKKTLKEYLENPVFDQKNWPEFILGFARFSELAQAFSSEFTAAKLREGQIDMLDLELLALRGLREYPDSAAAFAADWDYWFIDEFQDTSPLQVELFRYLVGDRHRLIVGDPQQSIYLFRGADVEVFHRAQQQISEVGGECRELMRNYRSEPELLLFLNDFFSRLSRPFTPMEPNLSMPGVEQLDANKLVAYFAVPEVSEDEKVVDKGEQGAHKKAELAAIGQHVSELLNQGAQLDEICILARKRSQLDEVASFLSQHGYPTQVHSAAGFWQRREVKDCVCLLSVLVNPHDNRRLIELLRSPWFFVADQVLAEELAAQKDRTQSFWQIFRQAYEARPEALAAIGRLLDLLDESSRIGITATVQRAVAHGGLVDWSHRHDSTGQRESNLWKFIQRLRQEERRPGFNFLEFLRGAGRDQTVDTMGLEDGEAVAALEPNRINLMTVHGSKGLQFTHVLLPFCDRAQSLSNGADFAFVVNPRRQAWALAWPALSDDDKKVHSPLGWEFVQQQRERERQESLRLLYVALTRAKKSVFLSWSGAAQRDSWLLEMGWPTDLVGLNRGESYSYRVDCGPWTVPVWQGPEATDWEVRAPFQSTDQVSERRPNSPPDLRVSVSALLDQGAEKMEPAELRTLKQVENMMVAAQRGTLIHRLFELIKYSSPAQLAGYVEEWFGDSQDEVRSALRFVMECSHPPLLQLIQQGNVEWGFLYREDDQVIEGQIDLWGQLGEEVWVVDYKTGSTGYSDKAFEQLNLYAKALCRMGYVGSVKAIQRVAIYPFEQKVLIQPAQEV